MNAITIRRPARLKDIENLSGLLDRICGLVDCGSAAADQNAKVQVRAIFETIGRRAYGPLLLALGLFSISPLTAIPGMTWASAGLTLIIAVQLTFGMQRPWVPPKLLAAEVSASGIVKAVDALRPWARRIDVLLRPRFDFLARPPFVLLIGLMVALAAAVTFPLGFIPLAPIVPGLAIVLFGLGLVARDGLLLMVGTATVMGAIALATQLIERLPLPW